MVVRRFGAAFTARAIFFTGRFTAGAAADFDLRLAMWTPRYIRQYASSQVGEREARERSKRLQFRARNMWVSITFLLPPLASGQGTPIAWDYPPGTGVKFVLWMGSEPGQFVARIPLESSALAARVWTANHERTFVAVSAVDPMTGLESKRSNVLELSRDGLIAKSHARPADHRNPRPLRIRDRRRRILNSPHPRHHSHPHDRPGRMDRRTMIGPQKRKIVARAIFEPRGHDC